MSTTVTAETETQQNAWGPAALDQRRTRTQQHMARVAAVRAGWVDRNAYYYRLVERLYHYIIEPGKRVLSIRCDDGVSLKAARPSVGRGIDICEEILNVARKRNPGFHYDVAFPDTDDFTGKFSAGEKFDYIIFNNIDDTVDVQRALQNLKPLCDRYTRILITTYNHLWQPLVSLAEKTGAKVPRIESNWLSTADIRTLLELTGFEVLDNHRVVLMPKYVPLLSALLNHFFAKLPGLNQLCMTQVLVARLVPEPIKAERVSVSVIIPCKDERGNIEDAVKRIPKLGARTEIIFCDDKSTDGTADEVRRMQQLHPDKQIRLENGPGICKSKNVWTGFNAATGDILMILDADLTTMPEELPYFLDAMLSGKAEFVNGSRLIYPVPHGAMKSTNMLGNKFFSLAFSYLLNQRVKDTLCGTKVLWKADWERVKPMIGTWGIEDRWGDYELLFGASKLNLRIYDQPVHYQERIYGSTKMTRVFHNGIIMLKMCWHGFLKLKLGY